MIGQVARVASLLHRGMTTRAVMRVVGQPYERLGTTYRFCAKRDGDPKVMVTVTFSRAGRVAGVEAAARG